MPTFTDEQKKEIEARVGPLDTKTGLPVGFNVQLPSGEVVPSAMNPGEAATIVLGGGVLDRGTSQGSAIASRFPVNPVQPGFENFRGPEVPLSNFPSGTRAPYQTTAGTPMITPSTPLKPIPNSGSDSFYGFINGRPQTFTSKEAAVAAGALNIAPVPVAGSYSPPQNQISTIGDLIGNAQIRSLEDKLTEISSQIKSGIASGGATAIMEGLFKKFGVAEETTLLNDYNKQILETQQRLRKLPDDIKTTLSDVGVSEGQLNRLIVKETQKPLETLRDLMENRGAAQDRINQALKFVGLFGDAMMQDRAAQIEALKFDFETNKFMLGRLDDKQKELFALALEEQKRKLGLVNDLAKAGASEKDRTDAFNLTSEEILTKYGGLLSSKEFTTEFRDVGGRQMQYVLDKDKNIIKIRDLGPSTLKDSENKPLSPTDIANLESIYPGLGLKPGDTMGVASDLFTKNVAPRDWSDADIRSAIKNAEAKGQSPEEIQKILYDQPSLQNIDRAIEIYNEIYNPDTPSLIERIGSWFGGFVPSAGASASAPSVTGNISEGYQPITLDSFQNNNISFPSTFNF